MHEDESCTVMSVLRREYNEELIVGPYGSRRYQMEVSIFKLEEDGSLQNMQLSYKTPCHRVLCII